MKTLLSFLFTFLFTASLAQAPLCVTPATESFAALGNNTDFVSGHLDPLPYNHQDAKGHMIEFDTPDGKMANAYFVDSEIGNDNYLLVFHEWWGLNDHIKKQVDKLSSDLPGVHIVAIDLYDGKVASTAEKARDYMQQVSRDRAESIIKGAVDFMGTNAEYIPIGWCFGGGWALQAGIMGDDEAVQGVVMYYGMPEKDPERLKNLNAPVLGIFAEKDGHITPQVVDNFKVNMAKANQKLMVRSYDAAHAFANPSNPAYNKEAAEEAYGLAITFIKNNLN